MAEDEEEEECPFFVGSLTSEVQIQNIEWYVNLSVQGQLMPLKVAIGSQVNIVPLKELKKIQVNDPTWRYATTNWLATREIISQH